jgi:hypothetical protein
MANALTGNPIFIDTAAGSSVTGPFRMMLLQWVDDNADIADNGNLILIVNGVTIEATVQRGSTPDGPGAVLWQIGPFSPGISIKDIEVNTISAGQVHIWKT